jgi:AraC family transcriptional regulator
MILKLRTEINIQPEIKLLCEKKLVGMRQKMSFSANMTGELWRNFMPRRNEIKNRISAELYSMQLYSPGFFNDFDPSREFVKWAAAEVLDFSEVPNGMESVILPGGIYAVFIHRGTDTDNSTFQYIFTDWLPKSGYLLDNRPHFEVLGEKFKLGDPASEEEIWIPVKES